MPFVISGLNVARSPCLMMPYSDIIQEMLTIYKDPMSSVSLKSTKHRKENRLQDLRYSHYIVAFSDNSLFVSRPRYYVLLFMLLCSSRSACTVVCMRLSSTMLIYSWSADALEALTLMSASELFVMTEEVGSHWNSKVTNGEQPIMESRHCPPSSKISPAYFLFTLDGPQVCVINILLPKMLWNCFMYFSVFLVVALEWLSDVRHWLYLSSSSKIIVIVVIYPHCLCQNPWPSPLPQLADWNFITAWTRSCSKVFKSRGERGM